jgi:hypothetical protein
MLPNITSPTHTHHARARTHTSRTSHSCAAACQRNCNEFYPFLAAMEDDCQDLIADFFEDKVQGRFPDSDCEYARQQSAGANEGETKCRRQRAAPSSRARARVSERARAGAGAGAVRKGRSRSRSRSTAQCLFTQPRVIPVNVDCHVDENGVDGTTTKLQHRRFMHPPQWH